MISNGLIELEIEKLLDLMLTSGIQPSDLADNIFLNEYKSVSYKKQNQNIIGELVFEDMIESKIVSVIMRYSYDHDKKINKIEEEVDGKAIVLWDRSVAEGELINDIIDTMNTKYSNDEVGKFIMTLPEELKHKINSIKNSQVA